MLRDNTMANTNLPDVDDAPLMTRARPLAQKYSVSLGLIAKWVKNGTLPSKRVGHVRLIDAAAADALLGSRKSR